MDSLPVRGLDSPGATADSVKSDDSSPRHDPGRGSPPPNCAICLGTCRNKSFTDSCLHQFCFKCLLTWSKVKAECPLCKQNFRSIIHNVRSNHQYEEYMVEQRHTEEISERIDIDSLTTATRRFRYRTTLTLPRQNTIAIQQLLLHHYPMVAELFPGPPAPRRRSPASFRRTVYRYNLWARPLPDFTRRFRDCSPDFYRHNASQMHRLVPWLNRELHYLLNENVGHISYVVTRILELLPQYSINSSEFRDTIRRYLGENTDHFLHELYCFASTPYDMSGYDRHVQYTTDNTISTMVNNVLSSSESDASVDSDIVVVSSSAPAEPPPGPSRVAPVYPQSSLTGDGVIPIETISHTDSDDDSSEVMVVGYIKPPQDRTPEVVDLLGSDSDVIVQESAPPERETNNRQTLVKLTLARAAAAPASDSESAHTPPHSPPLAPRRARRRRSDATATTADTRRTTPSPLLSPVSSSINSVFTSPFTDSEDDTAITRFTPRRNPERRRRKARKRSQRQRYVPDESDSSPDRHTPSPKRHKPTPDRHTPSPDIQSPLPDRDVQSKHKSHSGKGVKSTKKSTATDQQMQTMDQPSISGISSSITRLARNFVRGICGSMTRNYSQSNSTNEEPGVSGVSYESKQPSSVTDGVLYLKSESSRGINESSSSTSVASRDKSEASRCVSVTSRDKSGTSRDTGETSRSTSGASRDKSVTSRGTGETSRSTSVASRDRSETSRVLDETSRSTSAASREKSETSRRTSVASRDKSEESRGTKRKLKTGTRRLESKRLKSVVNVVSSQNNGEFASVAPASAQRTPDSELSEPYDSDDDLPLNLSIMKGARL